MIARAFIEGVNRNAKGVLIYFYNYERKFGHLPSVLLGFVNLSLLSRNRSPDKIAPLFHWKKVTSRHAAKARPRRSRYFAARNRCLPTRNRL